MNTKREPLAIRSTATAVVSAVIVVLVAFGAPISDEQTVAIVGLVAIVAPLVVAAITRHKVTPVEDPR